MNNFFKSILGAGAALALTAGAAFAAELVVTPTNQQGWSIGSTTAGGGVNFVEDENAPLGEGALQLTTNSTNESRAQYVHGTSTLLTDVTDLSYFTRQLDASTEGGSASYQLAVDTNGDAAGGFTTLVFEPYWQIDESPDAAPVVADTWQQWDVDSGLFWSSRTIDDGTCQLTAGAGGPPFYTLAELQEACPDAVVSEFGVNVGTFNPDYTIRVDALTFNDTTYNFEVEEAGPVVNEPTSKDACKKGGYQDLTDAEGNTFRNQGQCVSYFNHL